MLSYQWTNTVPPEDIACLINSIAVVKCFCKFSNGMSSTLTILYLNSYSVFISSKKIALPQGKRDGILQQLKGYASHPKH